ncbi:hypothetical protein [Crassaminicella profunda]|uniref:hypothetical protein n=1 Tax=Crassaminicella profunda TaxID=1286698 RepID=UPI001CA730ED|nr:hypothetical protein [Crassaminicella profunda]QZY56723.1 hypothetical protein K7H06_07320 [Crassaminicella profunda]
MKYTANYGLEKPGYEGVADIESLNRNADKIDQKLKENADGLASHLAETVTDGVHGLQIEEGEWTPELYTASLEGIVYSVQNGKYKKINDAVHISGEFTLTNKGISSENDIVLIRGLPFSSGGNITLPLNIQNTETLTNTINITTDVGQNNEIRFRLLKSDGTGDFVRHKDINNNTSIKLAGLYYI